MNKLINNSYQVILQDNYKRLGNRWGNRSNNRFNSKYNRFNRFNSKYNRFKDKCNSKCNRFKDKYNKRSNICNLNIYNSNYNQFNSKYSKFLNNLYSNMELQDLVDKVWEMCFLNQNKEDFFRIHKISFKVSLKHSIRRCNQQLVINHLNQCVDL